MFLKGDLLTWKMFLSDRGQNELFFLTKEKAALTLLADT